MGYIGQQMLAFYMDLIKELNVCFNDTLRKGKQSLTSFFK